MSGQQLLGTRVLPSSPVLPFMSYTKKTMKKLFFALENKSFWCTFNRSCATLGRAQAFPVKLPSTQKLPWVPSLVLVQHLGWEQDVPKGP